MAIYHNQLGAQPVLAELSEIIGVLSKPGLTGFKSFLSRSCDLLDADAGSINRVNKITYITDHHVEKGSHTVLVGELGPASGCLCLKTLETKSIVTNHDFPSLRVGPYYSGLNWEGYIGYPLVVNGVRIGTLTFKSKKSISFTPQQLVDRKLMLNILGQAVQNKILLESLNNKISDFREELETKIEEAPDLDLSSEGLDQEHKS